MGQPMHATGPCCGATGATGATGECGEAVKLSRTPLRIVPTMENNALLQTICRALTLSEQDLCGLFQLCDRTLAAGPSVELLADCSNEQMRCVLEGLILSKRGPRQDGEPPSLDGRDISNNEVLKKLRIAFDLQQADMQLKFEKGGAMLSRGEFSGLFRKPGSKNFRACSDELLLQFINGLQLQPDA